jgi:hypothetical protein
MKAEIYESPEGSASRLCGDLVLTLPRWHELTKQRRVPGQRKIQRSIDGQLEGAALARPHVLDAARASDKHAIGATVQIQATARKPGDPPASRMNFVTTGGRFITGPKRVVTS